VIPVFVLAVTGLFFVFDYNAEVRSASVPGIITYQGKLLESDVAVTTTKQMKFLIYTTLTGGSPIYTASGTLPTTSSIDVVPNGGVFSVDIGDGDTTNAFTDLNTFRNNSSLFLEVIVGSQVLTPRKQLTSAPYAIHAEYLAGYFATSTATNTQHVLVTDTSGNLEIGGDSQSTAVGGGLLYLNPAATSSNHVLFGIDDGATTLLTLDAEGDLYVRGAISASSTLTVADNVNIGGDIYLTNEGDNFIYFDNGTTNSLKWDNAEDRFEFNNDVYVDGDFTFTGSFVSNTQIGAFIVTTSLQVTGTSTLATTTIKDLTVGDITVTSTFNLNGGATFNVSSTRLLDSSNIAYLDANNIFSATTNTFNTNVVVTGTTTLATTTILALGSDLLPAADGTYDLGSATAEWQDLFLDGTATLDALVVSGHSSLATASTTANITVGGSADIDGDLNVDGNSTTTGKLKVVGQSTLSTVSTTGNVTVAGSLDVDTNVNVDGTLDVTGSTTIDTDTFVVDADNNRVGVGTTTPVNTFSVSGTASIIGDTYIGANAESITRNSFTLDGNDLFVAGQAGIVGPVHTNSSFIATSLGASAILNVNGLTSTSTNGLLVDTGGNFLVRTDGTGAFDNYFTFSTDSDQPSLYWSGVTTTDPGIRINSSTHQIEYRDENSVIWTPFDSISLWENGGSGVFEDDEAVIVGASSTFSWASGGVGDLRVADELEVIGGAFVGGNLTVTGTTNINSTLTVTGGTTLATTTITALTVNTSTIGRLTVTNTLDVTNVTITGISLSDLDDATNTAKLDADQSFTGANTFTAANTTTVGRLSVTNTLDVTDATINGLSSSDLSDSANIAFVNQANVFQLFNVFSDAVQINGNLTATTGTASFGNVNLGTSTSTLLTVSSTIQGAGPLIFEGATADDFETKFVITDPTADNAITFQDGSGTLAFTTAILWEDGTNGVFEDDEAVIVGADSAFLWATGGVGDLKVSDELEVATNAYIGGDLFVTSTLSVTGTAKFNSTITVVGTSDFQGNIADSGGDLTIADNTIITGTADLQGDVSDSGGVLTLADNVRITASTTLADTLTVKGQTTLATASTTGNVTIGGTADIDGSLNVDGNTTTTGKLDVTGQTTLTTASTTGNVTIAGDADIDTNLNVDGNTTLGGTFSVVGTSDLQGNVSDSLGDFTIADNAIVTGNTTLQGNITLGTSTSTLLTVSSTIQGAGPLIFEGATADDFETKFVITDPTADNAITFQDGSGTLAFTTAILWEDGTNGVFEDDEAVIVGADSAFLWATGGVGDLKVSDELEVATNAYIGGDLFVTSTLSVTGTAKFNSTITVVGTSDFQGNIADSGGDLTIADNTIITGTADLQGDVSDSTGDLTLNDVVNITGSTTIDTDTFFVDADNNRVGVGTTTPDTAFHVSGTTTIEGNAIVGAATSPTETIDDPGFVMGGDDLFVAGTLGVEGTIVSDTLVLVGQSSDGVLINTSTIYKASGALNVRSTAGDLTLYSQTSGNVNILAANSGSNGDINLQADGDTDDYLYINTQANSTSIQWQGVLAYTNDPGFRINGTSGELEYRDEDEGAWTTFDSLDNSSAILFEDGTNGVFEDDEAVIVGADSAFLWASGGVGDLKVADELEVATNAYIGGDLFVTSTLSVTGTAKFNSTITVVGTSDFQGNIADSGGDLTIADNVVITGTSDLQGNVSDSAGVFTIADNTRITGSTTIADKLSVTGSTTIDTDTFVVDATSSRVGIGTTSPDTAFHVSGTTTIEKGLIVGAATSDTETLANANFLFNGDDLFVAGQLGVDRTIFTDLGLIIGTSMSISNGFISDTDSAIAITANNDASDYIYFSTAADQPGIFWEGVLTYTNDPGIRVNATSGELEYRDEDQAAWVAFDAISLWENGGSGVFEDDEAVIVGASSTFSWASGGVGDLRVADELEVVGDIYFGGNLIVTGTADLRGNISDSTGDLTIADNAVITGISDLQGDVSDSAGILTLADNTRITGSTTLADSLNVKGNVTTTGKLDVTGQTTLTTASTTGNVTIAGDADIDTNLNVDGNTTLGGTFSVVGTSDLQGNVSDSLGDFTIADNAIVTGNTTLQGNTTLGTSTSTLLTVSSTIQGAGPLTFEGATADDFETKFVITDPTADNTITFQDGSGTLAFTSAILWEDGTSGVFEDDKAVIVGADSAFLWASGGIGDLKVADELEVVTNVYIGGDLFVTSTLSVTGTAKFNSSIIVVGTADFQGNIADSGGDLTIADNTVITGTTDLQGNVSDSTGDLTLADAIVITGSTTIDTDTFFVDADNNRVGVGTTTPDTAFHVVGTSTFANDVFVEGRIRNITNIEDINTAASADAVVVKGDYLYVAAGSTGLEIYDVSDPHIPTLLATEPATGNVSRGLAVEGDYAYLAEGSGGVAIIDVSDPTSPTTTARIDDGGVANNIQVVGTLAYLANGSDGVRIYDVSNPRSLGSGVNISSLIPNDLHVVGDYLYVADDGLGLLIYDVSDYRNPVLKGSYDDGDNYRGVFVVGNKAYVAADNLGLIIYDISDPSTPTSTASIDNSTQAWDIFVAGDFAYLANYGNGLWIYDISSSTNPTFVESIDNGGFANDVYVNNGYIYLANLADGVRIYDVGRATIAHSSIGTARVGDLQVMGRALFGESVDVSGGLSIGSSGLLVNGDASFMAVTSTQSGLLGVTTTLHFNAATLFTNSAAAGDNNIFTFDTQNSILGSNSLLNVRNGGSDRFVVGADGSVTSTLGTNAIFMIDASTTAWTNTNEVAAAPFQIDMRVGANFISGSKVDVRLDDSFISQGSVLTLTSDPTGHTAGNSYTGYFSRMIGTALDTNVNFSAFYADAGGIVAAGTQARALETGLGFDYVLYSQSGDIIFDSYAPDIQAALGVTTTLGANGIFNINAEGTDVKQDGALSVVRSSDVVGGSAIRGSMEIDSDTTNSGIAAIHGKLTGFTSGGTQDTLFSVFNSQIQGDNQDSAVTYRAYNATASSTSVGSSTMIALDVDNNFDYLLDADSGDIQFNNYSPTIAVSGGNLTIQASKTTNSGNIILDPADSTATSTRGVGINTSTPDAYLTVMGPVTQKDVIVFDVISNVSSTNNRVFRVDSDGKVVADGGYSSSGADYAEYFYSWDTSLQPGEVVCIDIERENAIERCKRAADGNIMGIVSHNPSVIGNHTEEREQDPHYHVIGMLGQVRAKSLDQNGDIRVGDSLTSASSTGFLMKAKPGDPTVGVALQALDGQVGAINVLISRRNKSLTVEAIETQITERIAAMEIEDEVQLMISASLENLELNDDIIAVVDEQLAALDLDQSVVTLVDQRIADINIGGLIDEALAAEELDIVATIDSEKEIIIDTLDIPGLIDQAVSSSYVMQQSEIDEVSGVAGSHELAIAELSLTDEMTSTTVSELENRVDILEALQGQVGDQLQGGVVSTTLVADVLTVETRLVVMGDLRVEQHSIFNEDTIGQAKILPGDTFVRVQFAKEYSYQPVVTLTLRGENALTATYKYTVVDERTDGFTIKISEAQGEEDVEFNWHAFAVNAGKITVSDDTYEDIEIILPPEETNNSTLLEGEEIGTPSSEPNIDSVNDNTDTASGTDAGTPDTGSTSDGTAASGSDSTGTSDSGSTDTGSGTDTTTDTTAGGSGDGSTDAGTPDTGSTSDGTAASGSDSTGTSDSGSTDTGSTESGSAGSIDSGENAGTTSSGSVDSGSVDSGTVSSGGPDSGSTGSGATEASGT